MHFIHILLATFLAKNMVFIGVFKKGEEVRLAAVSVRGCGAFSALGTGGH
jgi:hypothetical protein